MADLTKPTAPTVTATLTQRAVMKWSGASDNTGIAYYEAWDGPTFLAKLASTSRQYTTPPLTAGPHALRIVAYDAAGNYANSVPVTVTVPATLGAPAPVPVPVPVPAPDPVKVPPPSTSPFQRLVVDEQFTTLDTTRWGLYGVRNGTTPGHAGNGYRDPACFEIRSDVAGATGTGCLVGTARWDAAAGKLRAPAMALRYDALSFRVECRARVEKDPSGCTAANMPLLWPKDYSDADYEEVNPYETSGPFNPARGMSAFWHYGSVASGKPAGDQKYFDLGVDGSAWHTMVYERVNGVREQNWVDGVLKETITDPNVLAKREHHPCLQLDAVTGGNPGQPIRMFIDSLRVYVA